MAQPAQLQPRIGISLGGIFKRFRWRIALTLFLVAVESLAGILYPLFIGLAINDLLAGEYRWLTNLAVLGLANLAIGSARRFYDTRIYAGIYRRLAEEQVERERHLQKPVSVTSARVGLMTEFVEFMENTLPNAIGAMISLISILVLVAALDMRVFLACLALMLLVCLIYLATGKRNYRLNAGYNQELERQVDVLNAPALGPVSSHFSRLMAWNIRLSDLETCNYALIWLGVIALFVYTPVVAVSGMADPNEGYGLVFSLLMYVFDFIEQLVMLPLVVQQMIRLKEIGRRLAS